MFYSKYPLILSKKPLSFLSGFGTKVPDSLNFSMIFSSSRERFLGIHTLTLTSRSPFPYPFTSGRPFPLRRSIFPGWVVAFSYQIGVTLFINYNQQITMNPSSSCCIAFACDSHLHSLTDTCRNIDLNNVFFLNYSFTITGMAFLCDCFAFATACRAY
jgi:hypothetical protein